MDPLSLIIKHAHKDSILHKKNIDDIRKQFDFTDSDIKLLFRILDYYERKMEDIDSKLEYFDMVCDIFSYEEIDRVGILDKFLNIPVLALFYETLNYDLFLRLVNHDPKSVPLDMFENRMSLYKKLRWTELKTLIDSKKITLTDSLARKIATSDNTECLKLLFFLSKWNDENPAEDDWYLDEAAMEIAIARGNLEFTKYLYDRYLMTFWATRAAARGGQLDCLKFLHEKKCKWDSGTTSDAALYGHLECLEYAYENGCPVSLKYCLAKAAPNCTEYVAYIKNDACLMPKDENTPGLVCMAEFHIKNTYLCS